MLATLWWPNTNPLGPGSLLPLCILLACALIMRGVKRRGLALSAAVLCAAAAVRGDGFPFAGGRRFPNADDFVGYYVWLLATCCFAIEAARAGSLRPLVCGGALLFAAGWLLSLEALARAALLASGTQDLEFGTAALISLLLWSVPFAAMMSRAAQPYLRSRRVARGLCGTCGYDVREASGRCPECGAEAVIRPKHHEPPQRTGAPSGRVIATAAGESPGGRGHCDFLSGRAA